MPDIETNKSEESSKQKNDKKHKGVCKALLRKTQICRRYQEAESELDEVMSFDDRQLGQVK